MLALGLQARAVRRRRSPTAVAARCGCTTPSSPSRSTPPGRSASPPMRSASTTRSSSPTATSSPTSTSPRSSPSTGDRAPRRRCTSSRSTIRRRSASSRSTTDGDRATLRREAGARATTDRNLINAGTYVLEPGVLERIPAGATRVDRARRRSRVVADGVCTPCATDDYWIDTGRPELYLQANLDLIRGLRGASTAAPDRIGRADRCRSVRASTRVVADRCRRRAPVHGSSGSVLLPGARIGPMPTSSRRSSPGASAPVPSFVDCVIGAVDVGRRPVSRSPANACPLPTEAVPFARSAAMMVA